ncbi:MAG: hypothetical protein M1831_001985, partial [Alyxoria varia]
MEEANVDLPWFDFVETNAKDLQDRLLNAGLSVKTVAPIVQIILAETKFTLGVKFGGDKELLEQIVNCVPKHNILLQKAIKSSHSSLLMHILTQTEKVYRDKFTEQWTAST